MKKLFLTVLLVVSMLLLSTAGTTAQDADLLIWADGTRAPALQGLVEQFTEEFGVVTEVQEIQMGDIRTNISIAGPAGEGPDIFIGAHDWVGELVANGAVLPMNLGDTAELFSPNALDLFTLDGELYAMPYAVENVAFFRNPELVPEAPETWDDVFAITEELVSAGDSEFGFIMNDGDGYHYYPTMSAFGGYVFGLDEDGNYDASDIGINSEGSIAAAQWVQDMTEAGYLIPAVDYDVKHALFEAGDSAMMITGPWALSRLNDSGIAYEISNLPSGPAGDGIPFIGGQGFFLSAFGENQLLAEAFLTEFMATPEAMLAMYEVDPRPPALIEALESIEDPAMAAFQAAGANGIPQPAIPEMSQVWGSWANAIQFVIQGELDAETAFNDAQAQIVEFIGEASAVAEDAVILAGSFQAQLGCAEDWNPACTDTEMSDNGDGTFSLVTTDLMAGDYLVKVTIGGTWDENYGVDGEAGGPDIPFTVAADNDEVTFTYDSETNVLTVTAGE